MNPLASHLQLLKAPSPLIARTLALEASHLRKWIQVIDESPYSVLQWAQALIEFESWTGVNHRPLEIEHMLEYISCCTESGTATRLLSLDFLLKEYLRDYGVED